MNKHHKKYSKHELTLVNNHNLTARVVANMTGRTIGAISMKRTHIKQTKNVKTINPIKSIASNVNSSIKEININGIKILIDGTKLNITI